MAQVAVAFATPAFKEDIPDHKHYYDFVTASIVREASIASSQLAESLPDKPTQHERQLGDSEVSYFLPSRADGVNDMYLHLGFHAPANLVQRARVRLVWAILRVRHPLLSSKVVMRNYDDISFVHTPRYTSEEVLQDADSNLEYRSSSKDELIDSYLNGPRTLSNDRLSYLIISQSETPDSTLSSNYDILICAAHFLGDGMALHQFANDFFGLLGSAKTDNELKLELLNECRMRVGGLTAEMSPLPDALEDRFPVEGSKFRRAVAEVDFNRNQEKQIGGHSFPRSSGATRHTVVPTVSIDQQRTKAILKNCKSHGVSISAALFAICNIAWARLTPDKPELPIMMYSALNLRPYFSSQPANDSYWFLAVGYFNVILSNYLPKSVDTMSTFWRRAQMAKEQSIRAVKNPMTVSRSRFMARERGRRSRLWAKEDDDKLKGTWVPPPTPPGAEKKPDRAPSTALIGLSLLGNLDGIYKHANFPEIELHALTTGSRQRPGGMLLFAYTFAGKLWVSLGYDENGFDKALVQKFWDNCIDGIEEFL